MDCPSSRNKDLLFRAIELMQSLLSPGEPPRFSTDVFPDYSVSEFINDLETCGKDEEDILASNTHTLFEITIHRKMPTIWLVKTRHPVFAMYAALCNWIKKPLTTTSCLLGETDFPKMTNFGKNFVQAPLHVIGIEDQTSLSSALKTLPTSKRPWTVLCNWRFDTWDSAVAEAYGMDEKACILSPE